MGNWTPGPWAVNPGAAQVDAMPSLVPVCQLLWPTDERTEAETEANARLIAAAPTMQDEMLRFLPILERAEADPETWARLTAGTGIATANGYRAAIARATGAES